ncbi:MAG: DNA repair protein RadA [Lachnospiraceae bacterium]|nr:DNA repair protein RadA [Lachnospiraceae bacterium]
MAAKQTKVKTVFFCKECGADSPTWYGKCPACGAWNTMTEEVVSKSKVQSAVFAERSGVGRAKPVYLDEVTLKEEDRLSSGIAELDRVLGGGIVPGSLTLVGGDPGIGKSTLLLQMCRLLSLQATKVLYVSGEESLKQIKMRAERIGTFGTSLKLLCETNLTYIADAVREEKPDVMIIDSIQTMYNEEISGSPGSVSQVRESTAVLLQISKSLGVSVFIVGHVTKEGTVAGPRVLEHMVDTVLYFEGDRHASYRLLRGVKNRFGSTNEIGVFEMREEGLVEVENPSEFMLNGRAVDAAGSVTTCSMEGTRPLLLELQALVCGTNFGIPRRQTIGADLGRVNLLMAVIEKRLHHSMGNCDAYVNIAGGLKITEPALDLAIVVAILSSDKELPVDKEMMVFGEVGLSGEVRAVSQAETRVAEAVKLGFTRIMFPKVCEDRIKKMKGIEYIPVETVKDAERYLFKK